MKMIDLPFDKDLAKLTQLSEQLKQSDDARECSRLADELLCKMESATLSVRRCLCDFLRPRQACAFAAYSPVSLSRAVFSRSDSERLDMYSIEYAIAEQSPVCDRIHRKHALANAA